MYQTLELLFKIINLYLDNIMKTSVEFMWRQTNEIVYELVKAVALLVYF